MLEITEYLLISVGKACYAVVVDREKKREM